MQSLLVPLVRVAVLVLRVQGLHFFLRMSRAAASARAFSFRVNSRSRLRTRRVSAVEADSRSSRARRHRSNSARCTPSRARSAVSRSPSSSAASARRAGRARAPRWREPVGPESRQSGSFRPQSTPLVSGRSGTTLGKLRASASQRDRFCCRTPVSRDSCTALIPSLSISRCTIFCLKASEYGFVTSFRSHAPRSSP